MACGLCCGLWVGLVVVVVVVKGRRQGLACRADLQQQGGGGRHEPNERGGEDPHVHHAEAVHRPEEDLDELRGVGFRMCVCDI